MGRPRRRKHREDKPNDLTRRYLAGEPNPSRLAPLRDTDDPQVPESPDTTEDTGEDEPEDRQTFSRRSKHHQANKTARTTRRREKRADAAGDATLLPGRVVRVYSLFLEVRTADGVGFLCTARKTLARTRETKLVVGDHVGFRVTGGTSDLGLPEGVIERLHPRRTVLTRAGAFRDWEPAPIVANADRLLIVVAAARPRPKWGLVDRMLVAAAAGGIETILCLNKIDLLDAEDPSNAPDEDPLSLLSALEREVLGSAVDVQTPPPFEAADYYASIAVPVLRTSVERGEGLDALRDALAGRVTVLAGHSGVGKSSLLAKAFPEADLQELRVGDVSDVNEKGTHTTTGGRLYPLGGDERSPEGFESAVIDTPGVKVFGLWGVTADGLLDRFPDITDDTAPPWRRASYDRLVASLPAPPGDTTG